MVKKSPPDLPHFVNFERILFFTGAGLSAESGIPTYRGTGGLWKQYNYREYACQSAFEAAPDKVWDFHDQRRALVAERQPNLGHTIITQIQQTQPQTRVITQNIDGLHQRAGTTEVLELHGSLWRVRCEQEGIVRPDFSVPMAPRRCQCGAWWRPDIVWFEDSLDNTILSEARQALNGCDLLVSVGTSGLVYPAADLPIIAARRGIPCVEINLEDTPVSSLYRYQPRGKASDILSQMAQI